MSSEVLYSLIFGDQIEDNFGLEFCFVKIIFRKDSFIVGHLYRPLDKNILVSVDIIYPVVSDLVPKYTKLIILGGFNINLFELETALTYLMDSYGSN